MLANHAPHTDALRLSRNLQRKWRARPQRAGELGR
jgi:hypothetical protein